MMQMEEDGMTPELITTDTLLVARPRTADGTRRYQQIDTRLQFGQVGLAVAQLINAWVVAGVLK